MSQAGAGMKRNAEGWRQNNYTSIILASLMFRENFASLARILKSYHDHENFMFLMIKVHVYKGWLPSLPKKCTKQLQILQ